MQSNILDNIDSLLCMKDYEHAFTIEPWVQLMYIRLFLLIRAVYETKLSCIEYPTIYTLLPKRFGQQVYEKAEVNSFKL